MPCSANIIPPQPTLGGGLTIPPMPSPSPPDIGVCCQQVTIPLPPLILPLPIPSAALAAAASVLNAKLTILMAYLDAIPLQCLKS